VTVLAGTVLAATSRLATLRLLTPRLAVLGLLAALLGLAASVSVAPRLLAAPLRLLALRLVAPLTATLRLTTSVPITPGPLALVALLGRSGRSRPNLLGTGLALGPTLGIFESVGVRPLFGRLLVGPFRRRPLVGLLGRRSLSRRFGGVLVSGPNLSRTRRVPASLAGLPASLAGLPVLPTGLSTALAGLSTALTRLAFLRGELLSCMGLLGVVRVVARLPAEFETVSASLRGLLVPRGLLALR
jgi:hypothetical protein